MKKMLTKWSLPLDVIELQDEEIALIKGGVEPTPADPNIGCNPSCVVGCTNPGCAVGCTNPGCVVSCVVNCPSQPQPTT